jgi:hypothetical protein
MRMDNTPCLAYQSATATEPRWCPGSRSWSRERLLPTLRLPAAELREAVWVFTQSDSTTRGLAHPRPTHHTATLRRQGAAHAWAGAECAHPPPPPRRCQRSMISPSYSIARSPTPLHLDHDSACAMAAGGREGVTKERLLRLTRQMEDGRGWIADIGIHEPDDVTCHAPHSQDHNAIADLHSLGISPSTLLI